MAGASAVGVHTAPLLRGLAWLGKTEKQMERWLDARRHARLSDLRGVALATLRASGGHEPYPAEEPEPLAFAFDADTCTRCGRCVTVCAYQARELTPEKEMLLDTVECRSCGLCVTVCAPGSLRIRETGTAGA
jgi:dihydroorotate dehydrogenase (fumarate)